MIMGPGVCILGGSKYLTAISRLHSIGFDFFCMIIGDGSLLIGYLEDQVPNTVAFQKYIENTVGMSRFIQIDDLFGGESFVSGNCGKCRIVLVLVDDAQQETLQNWAKSNGIEDKLITLRRELTSDWNPDDKAFQAEVSPFILHLCGDILHQFPRIDYHGSPLIWYFLACMDFCIHHSG